MTTAAQDESQAAEADLIRTDECIESSFEKTYIYTTYLKDEKITIRSRGGNVILAGSVMDAYHKPMAGHTAEALFGVKDVDNQIVVLGEPVVGNSDSWIRSKVKAELLIRRNVSASKTEVHVNNGAVTLRGVASSKAQKELTAEIAKGVDGVSSLINEMTVEESNPIDERSLAEKVGESVRGLVEFIDDASITAQVRTSLLFNRATSALRSKVMTENGIVTLSGEAKNEAERDLVSKLVTDINGVTKVINNMTIASGSHERK